MHFLHQSLLSSEGTRWSPRAKHVVAAWDVQHSPNKQSSDRTEERGRVRAACWMQRSKARLLNRLGSMKIHLSLNKGVLLKGKFHLSFDKVPSRVCLTGHLLDSHILATIPIFCLLPISGWVSLVCWRVPLLFRGHHVLCAFDIQIFPGRGLGRKNSSKSLMSVLLSPVLLSHKSFPVKKQTSHPETSSIPVL